MLNSWIKNRRVHDFHTNKVSRIKGNATKNIKYCFGNFITVLLASQESLNSKCAWPRISPVATGSIKLNERGSL